jgi:hypothetical protein
MPKGWGLRTRVARAALEVKRAPTRPAPGRRERRTSRGTSQQAGGTAPGAPRGARVRSPHPPWPDSPGRREPAPGGRCGGFKLLCAQRSRLERVATERAPTALPHVGLVGASETQCGRSQRGRLTVEWPAKSNSTSPWSLAVVLLEQLGSDAIQRCSVMTSETRSTAKEHQLKQEEEK